MQVPQFLKRLEARVALALAKAETALRAAAALSHTSFTTNAAPVGPAATIVWSSPPFTSITGKVLVMGQGLVTAGGGTMVSGDSVVGNIVRDGVTAVVAGPLSGVVAGAAVESTAIGTVIDTVAPGSTHTWGIQAQIGGGHTGAYAINEAVITLIDLPV